MFKVKIRLFTPPDKVLNNRSLIIIKCLKHLSLHVMSSTRVGMSVNAVRKQSSEEEVQTIAKALIKSWKKLLDGSEEKKKDGAPIVSSEPSNAAPLLSNMKSEESAAALAPTLPPQVTSFPPAPVTADSVRNKCRELLVAALQTDGEQVWFFIFQEFNSTDMKYKTRLRSRISNLKDQKNPELRRNVLCGNISPQRIASMTAEEMASAELKQIREALTKESIREHQLSRVGGTETDMFVCSKCHGKSCTYTQVQTRSADEPMTTFVLCNSCGNRWKVNNNHTTCVTSQTEKSTLIIFFKQQKGKNKQMLKL
uniref:Transcription elongation factor n=1 Tax=Mola mola TaxID=94237 RepID=A0A3Q3WGP7_MOLML